MLYNKTMQQIRVSLFCFLFFFPEKKKEEIDCN